MKNPSPPKKPFLRFSPTAWAKLLFMRDHSSNEVGGFGIAPMDDLLYVSDFALVKQKVTGVSVSFVDEAVADFFEDQVAAGRKPEQFARIWVHTHPGNGPEPSSVDEATFDRVFGGCDWSVMAIIAQKGSTYARLKFKAGPGGELIIPLSVDYGRDFTGTDLDLWQKEYQACVSPEDDVWSRKPEKKSPPSKQSPCEEQIPQVLSPWDILDQIDRMEPMERDMLLEEISQRIEYWGDDGEVIYE